MKRKYKNNPIIEAVCEFQLSPDTKWDLTIPGLFYEKINKEFPNKEQRLAQELEVVHGTEGIQQKLRASERVLFLNSERNNIIQVGTQLLAVNRLKPYEEWGKFKKVIETAYNTLRETVEFQVHRKISLRYGNRIDIPLTDKDIDLDKYFDFRPYLGKAIPQQMNSLYVGCVVEYPNKVDLCKITLSNTVSGKPNCVSFVLELEYLSQNTQPVSADKALSWVEHAHDIIYETFEGCLTEPLREIFEEIK